MKLRIALYVLIFLLGFLSQYALSLGSGIEKPFSLASGGRLAPSEEISRESIQIYDDRIVIEISNSSLGRYADTGSMLPVLDENTKGIRIVPSSPDEINVGDIITYRKNSELIIHRVVEKGEDGDGAYFVLKGDNNYADDGKIRFSEIAYKTVGFLY